MEERRELRKLPRGERCPECGSQKFYLQDGLRFCSRGHQIEARLPPRATNCRKRKCGHTNQLRPKKKLK
ncbi:hypothetical protein EsHS_00001940 [Epichloe bromicola]